MRIPITPTVLVGQAEAGRDSWRREAGGRLAAGVELEGFTAGGGYPVKVRQNAGLKRADAVCVEPAVERIRAVSAPSADAA